jgi:crotonobetainyl-CoA:carnitine CoA-transferase CaiB-like acyl-CoA transferase
VAERVEARTAEALRALFKGHDVCCAIVANVEDALADPHFAARGVFSRGLAADGKTIAALPVPVVEAFRAPERTAGYPQLGEANALVAKPAEE